MNHLQTAYSLISSKKKERFDVILDPLQAVSQLAILSCCPIGTKLTIDNNLLFVQTPNWYQGLSRAWNHDSKDDVLLLFNAVQRYNKIYANNIINNNNNNNKNSQQKEKQIKKLTDLVTKMAINGIDNLMNTYSRIDNTSIVHTLVMYRNVLLHPDRFACLDNGGLESNISNGKNIEDVFANIYNVWKEDEMEILYRTLLLLNNDKSQHNEIIEGLGLLFKSLYSRIRKWMSDNIVY